MARICLVGSGVELGLKTYCLLFPKCELLHLRAVFTITDLEKIDGLELSKLQGAAHPGGLLYEVFLEPGYGTIIAKP